MSSTRKTSTPRVRAYRERVKRGEPRLRRSKKPIPDALIVPFPSNFRRDDSRSAHLATWGPHHDILPLHASNIVLVETGKLICGFSLRMILQKIGFYLHDCKLLKWGQGQRVTLAQCKTTTAGGQSYYRDLFLFDKNITAREFEQAALSAIRFALAEFRQRQAQAAPATEAAEPVDDGIARADDADAIPF